MKDLFEEDMPSKNWRISDASAWRRKYRHEVVLAKPLAFGSCWATFGRVRVTCGRFLRLRVSLGLAPSILEP